MRACPEPDTLHAFGAHKGTKGTTRLPSLSAGPVPWALPEAPPWGHSRASDVSPSARTPGRGAGWRLRACALPRASRGPRWPCAVFPIRWSRGHLAGRSGGFTERDGGMSGSPRCPWDHIYLRGMGLLARGVASGLGPDLRLCAQLLISTPPPPPALSHHSDCPRVPSQGRTIWALQPGEALSLVLSWGGSPLHVNSHPLLAASPNPAAQRSEPLPALSSPLGWGLYRLHCGRHCLVLTAALLAFLGDAVSECDPPNRTGLVLSGRSIKP